MRVKNTILALVASSVVVTAPAPAQTTRQALEAGAAAYARGDYATAWGVFKVLAEQGQIQAAYSLGWMYSQGLGVPRDDGKAVKWYRYAAEQGDAWSQHDLGVAYAYGWGVPQDFVQAYKWFTLALERYPASETVWRERAFEHRDRIVARMTPQQIEQAQQLAQEWVPKKVAIP